jgi:hypothetical protein
MINQSQPSFTQHPSADPTKALKVTEYLFEQHILKEYERPIRKTGIAN